MKKILILMIFPFLGYAQFKSDDSGHLYYEKVFQIENMQQNEIKNKVHEWTAVTFNDANNVIKMNTDDRIVTNGLFTVDQPYKTTIIEHKVKFSIITDFKDGRYKVLINNLSSQETPISDVKEMTFERWKGIYEKSLEGLPASVQKANLKLLKNEKKLREMYEEGMSVHGNLVAEIKVKISRMAEDLASYVQDGSNNTDGW